MIDNEELQTRYKNNIDTVSLMDTDATAPSAEEIAASDIEFAHILRDMPTDRQRFVALSLFAGYNLAEIAYILQVDSSDIRRMAGHIRKRLVILNVRYKRR